MCKGYLHKQIETREPGLTVAIAMVVVAVAIVVVEQVIKREEERENTLGVHDDELYLGVRMDLSGCILFRLGSDVFPFPRRYT